MSDTPFKRAEAKPVPDNWQSEIKDYQQERSKYMIANREKVKTQWSPADRRNPKVLPTSLQVFSFLETVITMPDVLDAIMRRWILGEEEREQTDADHDDSVFIGSFCDWWAYQYTDCSYETHNLFSAKLRLANSAVVAYLRGATIEEAYEKYKSRLIDLNYWDFIRKEGGYV